MSRVLTINVFDRGVLVLRCEAKSMRMARQQIAAMRRVSPHFTYTVE